MLNFKITLHKAYNGGSDHVFTLSIKDIEPYKNITVKGKPEEGSIINGGMRYRESVDEVMALIRKPKITVTNFSTADQVELSLSEIISLHYCEKGKDGLTRTFMRCEGSIWIVSESVLEIQEKLIDAGWHNPEWMKKHRNVITAPFTVMDRYT